MVEALKEEMNKSLNEIQKNIIKQVKAFKEEMNKFLKEIQENKINQVNEINKTVEDLRTKVEVIRKIQTEEILEMENLGKITLTTDASITNRIQAMEEKNLRRNRRYNRRN